MKKSLLSSLVLVAINAPGALAATNINGQITDQNGKPIAGAKVEAHGSKLEITTDKNGQFQLNDLASHIDELHISAKGYVHQTLDIEENASQVNIVLRPSSIEFIDVYATPLHNSNLESSTPVSVLAEEELKNKHSATLGETLKNELGVHSSYYGPVSASPIIRGLDGPRVMITQNGLDVGDASRVGPDHIVSTETATVKQIEVLRGPATLFYGSGAIGGVVNVVDDRVPTSIEPEFNFQLSHNTVADENEAAFDLNTGVGNFAFHLDAFWRDGDNVEIPANPESHEDEHHDDEDHDEDHNEHEDEHEEFTGTLENSATETDGFTVGASYLLDNGYVGVSFGQINRLYGIPGHDHGHEEEETEEEHEAHLVKGDMQQQRMQLLSELAFTDSLITGLNTKVAFTDYEHMELEGAEIGTVFKNDSVQIKTDVLLAEIADWHGAVSFEYKHSDFEAIGEEAFTPPSETESLAMSVIAERHIGDFLVQLGARIEEVSLNAAPFEFEVEHHEDEHEEDHDEEHEDEHDEEHEHEVEIIDVATYTYTPVSLSAGVVWDFTPGYNAALSYTRSERAPSASELFSYGAHIGTNSFEVGSIFELHEEDGESHFDLSDEDVELEVANNIELSVRKFEGDWGFTFNAFYNDVENYYFQANTGLFAEDGHDHEEHEEEEHDAHDEEHEDEHAEEEGLLPVYLFTAQDAEFWGFEAQVVWKVNSDFTITTQADAIRGQLKSGENLPRIPPSRLGMSFNYTLANTSFELNSMHHFEQDKVAEMESHSEAYTITDLYVNHDFTYQNIDMTAYFKVTNMFDEEGRAHSSFLKEDTMLPGRGYTLGLRGSF